VDTVAVVEADIEAEGQEKETQHKEVMPYLPEAEDRKPEAEEEAAVPGTNLPQMRKLEEHRS